MDYFSKISFPGLGIDEFKVENVAFRLGKFTVMWYGVIICLGIVCAFLYFAYRAGQNGIKFDDVIDYTLITVPIAIIGARLYFILFYGGVESFIDVIAIWNGGLAIYGGVLFGIVSVILISRHKKKSFFKLIDCIIPGVMLAQAIGRWGNFCNGEAFGGIIEPSSPLYFLRMGLQNYITTSKFDTTDMVFVHPTFLYESLWNLIGFILINIFYKKKKFHGEILLWYLAWYGIGRFFIEQLRTDSLYVGNTGIRISSVVGIVCFVIALPMIIVFRAILAKLKKRGQLPEGITVGVPFVLGIKRDEMFQTKDIDVNVNYNTEEFEKHELETDEETLKNTKSSKDLFTDEAETEEEKDELHISLVKKASSGLSEDRKDGTEQKAAETEDEKSADEEKSSEEQTDAVETAEEESSEEKRNDAE